MVFKARFLSSGLNFLFPLTQEWVIYADVCQSAFFSESSFQLQGCWVCGSILTASTATLLWKWEAGMLRGPRKDRRIQQLWVEVSVLKSIQNFYKGWQ